MNTETKKTGTCGCGRSPTGNCIGWHAFTAAQYEAKLAEYNSTQSNATLAQPK